MHLKLKMVSVLGNFLRSSRVIFKVSPFFFTTCIFQDAGSKPSLIPAFPFTLAFFTAAETGYSFARLLLESSPLKTDSLMFRTFLRLLLVPSAVGGWLRSHFQPRKAPAPRIKKKKNDMTVLL